MQGNLIAARQQVDLDFIDTEVSGSLAHEPSRLAKFRSLIVPSASMIRSSIRSTLDSSVLLVGNGDLADARPEIAQERWKSSGSEWDLVDQSVLVFGVVHAVTPPCADRSV